MQGSDFVVRGFPKTGRKKWQWPRQPMTTRWKLVTQKKSTPHALQWFLLQLCGRPNGWCHRGWWGSGPGELKFADFSRTPVQLQSKDVEVWYHLPHGRGSCLSEFHDVSRQSNGLRGFCFFGGWGYVEFFKQQLLERCSIPALILFA